MSELLHIVCSTANEPEDGACLPSLQSWEQRCSIMKEDDKESVGGVWGYSAISWGLMQGLSHAKEAFLILWSSTITELMLTKRFDNVGICTMSTDK